MLIQLSYWDIEEAIIGLVKKEFDLDISSEQIQGGMDIETTDTTYAFKKDKEGTKIVDRKKTVVKKTSLEFNGNSDLTFYLEPKENKAGDV